MTMFRLLSLSVALSLSTTACSSQRGRTVAYVAGGAAVVGGAALAIGSNMQEDEQGDVPFDELGVALGLGLVAAGALTVLTTLATSPDSDPVPSPVRASSLDDQLRAMAAAR